MKAACRAPDYRDFVIKIDRDGGAYRSYVIASPAGEGSAPLVPPVARESLAQTRTALDGAIRDLASLGPEASARGAGALALAQRLGTELYAALFRDRVAQLFDTSRGVAVGNGLRLKLRFDLSRPDSAWLAELPWELLRQPGEATFLSLNPLTPVVRYIEMQGAHACKRFAPPLRVLAVSANPAGSLRLDLEAERQRIEQVAEVGEAIEVVHLPGATLRAVAEQLRRDGFDVLHFMGHGCFDRATRRATLLFERPTGGVDPVSGEALANILQGCSRLRLAVLNACHSGEVPAPEAGDLFAGVATTLVRAGLPAAVAMRGSVSDQGAIDFSKSFYAALAEGDPIDFAATEARRVVAPDCTRSLEWSVPVLFMRNWDGRFFADGEPPAAVAQTAGELPPQPGGGVTIGSIVTYIGRMKNIGTVNFGKEPE
jgi:hypothetical protein